VKRAERHLTDQELVSRYFDVEDADRRVALHLTACRDCASRHARLAAALDADHDRVAREADAAWPTRRLAEQREAILRRLEHPRSARVLAFRPRIAAVRETGARLTRRPARWVVAAAMIVTVLGAYGNWWLAFRGDAGLDADAGRSAVLRPAGAHDFFDSDHESVLLAIDTALARPGARELRALDALTPYADDPVR